MLCLIVRKQCVLARTYVVSHCTEAVCSYSYMCYVLLHGSSVFLLVHMLCLIARKQCVLTRTYVVSYCTDKQQSSKLL